jgi:hypothetical protein
MSLQSAAASYLQIHYALNKRKKQWQWWQTQLYTSRKVYSVSSLLRDLSFQPVSGIYKHFSRMSPTKFEFLINLIGEQICLKDTTFRKAVQVKGRLALTLRLFGKWWFLRNGKKKLLWEASFGFAFLWTTKKSWTYWLTTANKLSGTRDLSCPRQDNIKRISV